MTDVLDVKVTDGRQPVVEYVVPPDDLGQIRGVMKQLYQDAGELGTVQIRGQEDPNIMTAFIRAEQTRLGQLDSRHPEISRTPFAWSTEGKGKKVTKIYGHLVLPDGATLTVVADPDFSDVTIGRNPSPIRDGSSDGEPDNSLPRAVLVRGDSLSVRRGQSGDSEMATQVDRNLVAGWMRELSENSNFSTGFQLGIRNIFSAAERDGRLKRDGNGVVTAGITRGQESFIISAREIGEGIYSEISIEHVGPGSEIQDKSLKYGDSPTIVYWLDVPSATLVRVPMRHSTSEQDKNWGEVGLSAQFKQKIINGDSQVRSEYEAGSVNNRQLLLAMLGM